mgnify:CR=1
MYILLSDINLSVCEFCPDRLPASGNTCSEFPETRQIRGNGPSHLFTQ